MGWKEIFLVNLLSVRTPKLSFLLCTFISGYKKEHRNRQNWRGADTEWNRMSLLYNMFLITIKINK